VDPWNHVLDVLDDSPDLPMGIGNFEREGEVASHCKV